MRKENGKRESPYKGILKFADEKKPQLSFAVVLSVLSSAFGIVPYIAVAILLQKALASSLTTTWAILLPVIALCGYLLKHTLYAKSTLCSHKVAYEIIKNILQAVLIHGGYCLGHGLGLHLLLRQFYLPSFPDSIWHKSSLPVSPAASSQ